ncbi:MAG TPA: YbaY family lipoprotein, partial [Allocoleopsis sp.]
AITLNMVTQGPNDPMCCPTQEVTRIYTVQPALVQTGGDPATPMPLPAPLPNRSSGSGSGSSSNAVPPENATTASVTGTITYLQRIALPPNARVEVKLQDVSRQDAPAQTLATQIIPLEGRQVPIPFELVYSPDQIDASHTYAVQARILVDDQLWFITTSRYAVLTQGNPTRIDLTVERTPSRSPQ